jgi:dephospho-CoA kinase
MKIIGLTGGIGSGKTTVANVFRDLGIPIYIADDEAKRLMNTSKVIRRKLIALFGEKSYDSNGLNKPYLASKIFDDKAILQKMNAIVHPKVGAHFKRWLKKQNADYIIKEAAIIFENDMQSYYDAIVLVTAETKTRIERLLKRDATTVDKIQAIMDNQLSDEEKIKLSDFVIYNNDFETTKKQVLKIHKQLQKSIK